ncbi:MAG: FAD-dependent monooxygenase, partial [Caldilineaceae bacterium]|nr:FAD-dependent monooxygenase [Caldilineaceae bacterium]
MKTQRTQIGIIGSGPAGLLLARLLQLEGIDAVVLERQSRGHVESRIRAGVLEQGTVEMLRVANASARMEREGLPHAGFSLAFAGRRERIDMAQLTGSGVMVYGQTEVTRDLINTILADGGELWYEAPALAVED